MDAMSSMTLLWLCQVAQTSSAVLLGGTAVLRLLAHGSGLGAEHRWLRLAWASGITLLLAGVLQLWLTAAQMSAQPLGQTLASGTLGEVLGGTRLGTVWCGRMGVLGAWVVVNALRRSARAAPFLLDVSGALSAAALLTSVVLAGHAHASDKRAWLLPADIAHAVAAGAWPGGLLPLALLLARARRHAQLVPAAVTITRRFSHLSAFAVGVLAFSGVLNGVGMVPTFAALWSTAYGRLILCKAALFLSMVGLGGVNRRMLCREEEPTWRQLSRNVTLECALAGGVLLATEALAMTAPASPGGD